MVTRLHNNDAVKIDPDSFAGTPVILGGITRVGLRINSQVQAMPTTGEAYARFIALYGQKVVPTFETVHVARALTNCALSGLKIAAASAGTGLTTYQKSIAEGGIRTSGANHDTHNFKEGLLYPTGIEVDHQGDARISYDLCCTYDGTNNPVVIATGVSLPTAPTDTERFTLGPVTLGGVAFTQHTGYSINFGIKVNSEGAESDIWDTFCWIENVEPTITIRGVDKKWFDAAFVPLTGLAMTHANTKLYLKKRAAGGTFVANATAEHIKVTMAGLVTVETAWDAGPTGKGTVSIKLDTNYDGTNLPIVINPASAIT
jgi:hypothetical protein